MAKGKSLLHSFCPQLSARRENTKLGTMLSKSMSALLINRAQRETKQPCSRHAHQKNVKFSALFLSLYSSSSVAKCAGFLINEFHEPRSQSVVTGKHEHNINTQKNHRDFELMG